MICGWGFDEPSREEAVALDAQNPYLYWHLHDFTNNAKVFVGPRLSSLTVWTIGSLQTQVDIEGFKLAGAKSLDAVFGLEMPEHWLANALPGHRRRLGNQTLSTFRAVANCTMQQDVLKPVLPEEAAVFRRGRLWQPV